MRRYFRHRITGDLGTLEERDGETVVAVKQGTKMVYHPMEPNEWRPEEPIRPLNHADVAQVAYAADRQLCRLEGLHKEAAKRWIDLKPDERAALLRHGLKDISERRKAVWEMIVVTLSEETA